jgi:predicted acetyltransferase
MTGSQADRTLQREAEVFATHLEEWRREHLGEFVLIKGDEIVGFYKRLDEAFAEGTRRFGLQEFFVKQITPRDVVNISLYGKRLLSA